MRRVLILLSVANVLAFLWWRGALDDFLGSPREPDRIARQINADALRIVPTPTEPPPRRRAPAGGPPPVAAPAVAAPSAGAEVCVELGPLEEARVTRLREFLGTTEGRVKGGFESIVSQSAWMVYTSSGESLTAGQRRVSELKKAGVMDIYLMPDGPFRNAISFGLFRTEEAARAHSESLGRQGVSGLSVVQRNSSEEKSMVVLRHAADLNVTAPQVLGQLSALVAELGLNPVPCQRRP